MAQHGPARAELLRLVRDLEGVDGVARLPELALQMVGLALEPLEHTLHVPQPRAHLVVVVLLDDRRDLAAAPLGRWLREALPREALAVAPLARRVRGERALWRALGRSAPWGWLRLLGCPAVDEHRLVTHRLLCTRLRRLLLVRTVGVLALVGVQRLLHGRHVLQEEVDHLQDLAVTWLGEHARKLKVRVERIDDVGIGHSHVRQVRRLFLKRHEHPRRSSRGRRALCTRRRVPGHVAER